jgi:hypothetical protein
VEPADAVIGAEVHEVADAPLLVQAEPEVILIPTLDAFGAEQGGEEEEKRQGPHERYS